MEYPRCKTCKHWNQFPTRHGFRGCNNEHIHPGYHDINSLSPTEALNGCVSDSDEGAYPLVTGPEFGCVLHEEKTS